jgi:hypothetical protein
MKAQSTPLLVASLALIAVGAFCVQSRAEEIPNFQIEIQAVAQGGPKFTVMSLSGKTLAACVLEISIWSEGKGQSTIVWDAALRGERPLEPGASLTENLPRVVGAPLPDKVEVIAGIWSDKVAFGKSDWVKIILADRAAILSGYEQEAYFLQLGLDRNWTLKQYLEELSLMPNPKTFDWTKSTLEANQRLDDKQEYLQRVIHTLLASLHQKIDLIRQAKSPAIAPTAP